MLEEEEAGVDVDAEDRDVTTRAVPVDEMTMVPDEVEMMSPLG